MAERLVELRKRLRDCPPAEAARLRKRIKGIERARKAGRSTGRAEQAVTRDLERAVSRIEKRRRNLPKVSYPPELPISQKRAEIAKLIEEHQVVVVCGETGSGKTTQLPKICLDLGRGVSGRIGHTQPRRLAARSLASRIADELNVSLGAAVGYKIRFTDQVKDSTLVKVMTDGILLAETQGDRFLNEYDTIIIDEAHERSLNIDFLLGYLRRLLPKRPDLKVIITSATIDPESFSEHFGGAPIINVSGRTYPVEVRYRPLASEDEDDEDQDQIEGVLSAIDELSALGPRGDILAFFPGERDIREAAKAIDETYGGRLETLPLFSRLSAQEQEKVFAPHPGRRVVLATNVAETSLTVPGIRYVIDTGLARQSRYSARTRVQRLPIEPISQASANQRSGRCGRVEAGVAIRLYAEDDFKQRDEFTTPEIQRTNLASVILQMKALRLGDIDRFPFLESPENKFIRDGFETLRELGALGDDDELTEIGWTLSRFPLDPRVARMILEGHEQGCADDVLVIAAALSAQDPRERPFDQQGDADLKHKAFEHPDSDFLTYLNLWRFFNEQKEKLSNSQFRKALKANFLSHRKYREWREVYLQLRRIVRDSVGEVEPRRPHLEPDAHGIHLSLLSGLLGSVGKLDEKHEYVGPRGLRFHIHPGSGLFSAKPKWVVAEELVHTTRLFARCVARVKPQWIEEAAGDLVRRTYARPEWNEEHAQVEARERVTLFGLELFPARVVHYGPVNPAEAREIFIHRALVEGEYRAPAPFLEHNGKVAARIERLEDKARRRDILADRAARFAFYDRIVPQRVYDGHRFEEWRKTAERRDPRALFMTDADLLAGDASDVTPERFPDSITARAVDLPLDYKLAPGDEGDGVTVTAPIEALNQLDPERAEWLVPGLLKEKVVALIKGMPKSVRTNFVPAPAFADRVLPRLDPDRGPLKAQLRDALHAVTGVEVPASALDGVEISDHLRMRIRVVDAAGEEIASGRDVRVLQAKLAEKARAALAEMPEHGFNRTGLNDWDFGDLPRSVEIERGGARVLGYPALADERGEAALRLFDDPDAADRSHLAGLRRLFRAHFNREFKAQGRILPGFDEMAVRYAPIGSASELREAILLRIAERAFLPDAALVRERAEWERRLDFGWNRLESSSREVCATIGQLLAQRQAVELAIESARQPERASARADVTRQLANLTPARFLTTAPWGALSRYPVYLAAARERLARLPGVERRDAELQQRVTPFENAMIRKAQEHAQRGIVDPRLEKLRWMIEEFRVSLWAQKLGTAEPVSEKRLEKQWEKVR
jgi:ATP-dependent helicase HrpA